MRKWNLDSMQRTYIEFKDISIMEGQGVEHRVSERCIEKIKVK